MIITIPNEKDFESDFFEWLIEKIRVDIQAKMKDEKFIKVDEYINKNNYFATPLKKNFSSKEILYAALYHLVVRNYWDRTIITFDESATIPNTFTKFTTVLRLINFGTVSILGYPIITDEFSYIEKNLDELYEIYEEGL